MQLRCTYVEGEYDKYKLMIWASPQYIFMYGNTCYVTCVNTYKAVPVSHCGCLVGVRLMYVCMKPKLKPLALVVFAVGL